MPSKNAFFQMSVFAVLCLPPWWFVSVCLQLISFIFSYFTSSLFVLFDNECCLLSGSRYINTHYLIACHLSSHWTSSCSSGAPAASPFIPIACQRAPPRAMNAKRVMQFVQAFHEEVRPTHLWTNWCCLGIPRNTDLCNKYKNRRGIT